MTHRVFLTRRALRQIEEIEEIDEYSRDRWGADVAQQYLDDLAAAILRIEEVPGLLRPRRELSPRLLFYPFREHVFVCDRVGLQVFVLCVWHGSMDFAGRLDVLEPGLAQEVDLLARQLDEKRTD